MSTKKKVVAQGAMVPNDGADNRGLAENVELSKIHQMWPAHQSESAGKDNSTNVESQELQVK